MEENFLVLFFKKNCLLLAVAFTTPATAGPPYVTDDPEPTRTGGWENYVYVTGTDLQGATAGQAGLELNYGAAPDLQLSLTLPEDYLNLHGLHTGSGDVSAGAKFRFLHASDDGWLPDVAVFPALTVPSGSRGVGARHISLFLPLWVEKDFGAWSTFGGGGFGVNPDAGQRNYGLFGWAVTHSVGTRLNVGLRSLTRHPPAPGRRR
jgi:hypothetical protein